MAASAQDPNTSGKSRSELALRTASGLVLAALALTTAWYDGWPFALFWTVAALLVWREWITLIGVTGLRRGAAWVVGCVAIIAAGGLAEQAATTDPRVVVLVAIGACLAALLAGTSWLWAAAGVVYAAVIAVVPIDLRGHPAFGLVAIFWMFAVVWMSDIGAYITGRTLGGPKLWPRISPKKTWSGFIGGLTAGTLAGLAVVYVARHRFGLGWFHGTPLIALTMGASAVSQGGDLLESWLKRRFGVKDSGHLIPGHGGVMDRLDSFWAVCVLLGVLLYGTMVGS